MHENPKVSLLAQEIGAPIDTLIIVGPTASGKTDLAVSLARVLDGEVISADSCSVYRGLDAGTAKPLRDAQGFVQGIPYHLLDCIGPDSPFDAGTYARLAQAAIKEVRRRGRTPIIAGGTGLYIRALVEGLSVLPARENALRERLSSAAELRGREWLHGELRRVDPVAAGRIPANNIHRVIRALEVYETTGRTLTEHWASAKPGAGIGSYKALSLVWEPGELRERIAARARNMWPDLLAEVKSLMGRFSGREPGFQSIGYREAFACLRGSLSSEEGLRLMTQASFSYAKRQRTWFRNQLKCLEVRGGGTQAMLMDSLSALHAI